MDAIGLKDRLYLFTKDRRFEFSMMTIIIASALLVGVSTFKINPVYENILITLDNLITIIFVIEITLRIMAEKRPLDFFKDGWNIFDFVIVAVSLIPVENNYSTVARLVRIFRMLRLITIIPELKLIITSLFKSAVSIGYVMILMFIIFYIYAVLGTILFETAESGLWENVLVSLLTLFRVMTFEDWTDVMYETMEIYPWSWIYYLTFIFLTTFTFLNMIIGIMIETLDSERKKHEKVQHEQDLDVMQQVISHNKALEEKLVRLENLLIRQNSKT